MLVTRVLLIVFAYILINIAHKFKLNHYLFSNVDEEEGKYT